MIKHLEKIAPTSYAEHWDNVGLLVGEDTKEVKKVMIALDPSTEVIKQAIEEQCDMLITHHPLIFSPMKRIIGTDFIGKRILTLMNHSIAYYAMHTNMDIAIMADESARMIGLQETKALEPMKSDSDLIGIGRVGTITATSLYDLAVEVKKQFNLNDVRVVGKLDQRIEKVAISTGSGEDFIANAIEMGADVLITGDIRHHKALDAMEENLCIIDAGHYGTERFMVEWLKTYLQDTKLTIVAAKEQSPFKIV
ncbi:Nif3-like dinuclear metal center hexameric protein [Anaerosporobacter faecicola]|uniref:Nif3-like dinuclear metal center hexameric protein n=1 Tax=Anaerosporobacter faecicola TaxID=2718714 RepID=UPI0014390A04|nr:Nif3-like dinuclear metal center hexameric protein [Anaerosporobacter faecicola]